MDAHLSASRNIRRKFAFFASGFMFAMALLCYFLKDGSFYMICIFSALTSLAFLLRFDIPYARFAALIFTGAAVASCLWLVHYNLYDHQVVELSGQKGEMTGYIADYPQVFDDYTRVDVKISTFQGEKVKRSKARIYIDNTDHGDLEPGDMISMDTALETPSDSWRFASQRYLNSQGIYFTASVSDVLVVGSVKPSIFSLIRRIPKKVDAKLNEILPQQEAGLMTALIFGDESGLSHDFDRDLRTVGLSHITAVSGMNVAFFIGIILMIFGRKKGTFVAIPSVFIFIIMTGAPASVIRAGIMQIIWLLSLFLYREPDTLTDLFVSAAIILIINPFSIADIGFLLSFSATLGMILYQYPIAAYLKKKINIKSAALKKVIYSIAAVLASTLSAQLFTLAIQMLFFGELSLASPLSNIAVIWASQYAFIFGLIAAAAGSIWLPLGTIIGVLPRLLCTYILRITPLFAAIPYASVCARSIFVYVPVIFIYFILILKRITKFDNNTSAVICIILLCVCSVGFSVYRQYMTSTAAVISTGTGQTTALRQNNHCVILGAGGPRDYAVSEIEEFLWREGLKSIDALAVGSYRNADINNVGSLLDTYPTKTLYLPVPHSPSEEDIRDRILEKANQTECMVQIIDDNCSISVSGINVKVYVNHSDDADNARLVFDTNMSGKRILTLGAVQPENLGKMLYNADNDQVDLLALGDYYSVRKIPGCAARLTPEYAVASSYYEIGTDTLNSLASAGSKVCITQQLGSFVLHFPSTDE